MSDGHYQPLIALLEVMLNLATPKVNVKPGGYSEDIFLNLKPEDKEEYECSICYQILKDPRQCSNKHKYCYSCIFVWSTTGSHPNHNRCPVCRTEGYYMRDRDLEEKVGSLKVKCHLKSCNWKGPLKLLGRHTHTTYTRTGLPYRSRLDEQYRNTPNETAEENDDLPHLERENRNSAAESGTRLSLRPPSITNRLTSSRLAGTQTARESSSQSNATNVQHSASTAVTPRTPHPPNTPRPAGQTIRRVPTLPSIVNHNLPQRPTPASGTESRHVASNRVAPSGSRGARDSLQSGYNNVRDRLRESRNRLDQLMTTFSSELERGRRNLTEFQDARERRRQEQLEEVRDLGRRLNYVATELRNLLDQRRQLRDDLEDITDDLSN